MIRSCKGELVVECDDCGEEECGGPLQFRDFIASLRDRGWGIERDHDGSTHAEKHWNHYCPDCWRDR